MKILSHRGYWRSLEEKNTVVAFKRSFRLGFGTETDLRDDRGRVVISHDPPGGHELELSDFLTIQQRHGSTLPVALNIKADGLQGLLSEVLAGFSALQYFCFDMSVPDALHYAKHGLRFFTRQSEIEHEPMLYADAAGVWMDCFFEDWIHEEHVLQHLNRGKQVCLVSPDLHKRTHLDFWYRVANWSCLDSEDLLICTDHPESARDFFLTKPTQAK
jgi:glycerophosphoryl diester phosphodiesterase